VVGDRTDLGVAVLVQDFGDRSTYALRECLECDLPLGLVEVVLVDEVAQNLGDQQCGVFVILVAADRLGIGLVGIEKPERAINGRADTVVIDRGLSATTEFAANLIA